MIKKLNYITATAIIIAILLTIITTILDTKYQNEQFNFELKNLEESIKSEYKDRLKESVSHTIKFIEVSYENRLIEQEKETQTKAKELNEKYEKLLLDDVRRYLYGSIFEKARYTWINKVVNFDGGDNYAIRLIHPNLKKTEGKLLTTKAEDIKGNKPYLEELNGVKKAGDIYFTYYFKQLDKDDITEKLSYAKLYKKLNWIIATGIPQNSLNKKIQKKKEVLEKGYYKHLFSINIVRISILALFVYVLLYLRKRLHGALRENKELNKKLKDRLKTVEKSLDKFFELPLNMLVVGKFTGEIQQINPGWKKILGYEDKELIDKNILEFVHPNEINKVKEEMQILGKEEITIFSETRIRAKDGKYKDLLWSITSLPKEQLIYGVAQDITELKEKTNLIYQQSKMAAIGEMTANIAHQWRQPLSIISTAASGIIVKKDINDLDDKFLINTMNQITESTKYLSQTIEDFRNFFSPHKEKNYFKIDEVVRRTLNLVEKRFENQNINIIKNIEDIEIHSFENELLQVILNLLNNARDQLIKEENEDKYIFINSFRKDEKIFIEIIDSGQGIDAKIFDRIFEPYFTTKEKSIGTGIGLYMSEEIITKHLKGEILVQNHKFVHEDKELSGAKFTIVLG